MLKNIVFDMGNVLLRFEPDLFITALGVTDPEVHALLRREVFSSVEWVLQDWGTLTEAESSEIVCARLPEELRQMAKDLIFRWDEPIRPIAGMAELVRDCKEAGLGIYLLSNASVRLPEYWPRVPGQEYFDGITVSALLHAVKPMPETYRHVLDTYNLMAEECLFVDDMPMNVSGALQVGMKGFVFRGDADALRQELKKQGVALA